MTTLNINPKEITPNTVNKYIPEFNIDCRYEPARPHKTERGFVYLSIPVFEMPLIWLKNSTQSKLGAAQEPEIRQKAFQTSKEGGYKLLKTWEADFPFLHETLFKKVFEQYNINPHRYKGGQELFNLPRTILKDFSKAKNIHEFHEIVLAYLMLNPLYASALAKGMRRAVYDGHREVNLKITHFARYGQPE